jgi:hypothetical protein
MKLSETAVQTLKNFSQINSGIVIKPGKTQSTISVEQSILAEAELDDDFPCEFGIYDLHEFLMNITAMNDPDLLFSDHSVVIKDSSMVMTYYSCAANAVTVPPNKKLSPNNPKAHFNITEGQLKKLMDVSRMNDFPTFTISGSKDFGINIKCHDNSNDTSNHIVSSMGDYTGDSFKTNIKTENIKIIPGDYEISIFESFTLFQNTKRSLKYFIAIEKGAKK